MDEPFETIAIVGIGLIGSSVAHAARASAGTTKVVGYDLSADVRAEALRLGVIDEAADSLENAVAQSDLVVLSTPVGAIGKILPQLASAKAGTVVMDVGSCKGSVIEAAQGLPDSVHFVPAHPVAGTEHSGPAAGFATLFRNRWCIITPMERSDEAYGRSLARVDALWRAFGSDVVQMDAKHHDLALAVTSHLPHLIAYTLVGAADDVESVNEAEVVKYSAGGFRDFTRIAASDPIMWRDVFINNKEAVLEVLGRFSEELAVMQRAIRWGDGEALEKAFARSRGLRKAIIEAGQESAEPNFGRDKKG
ncbi:prephenate/arogenate dehydrogenase family protein [Aquisalinus flavus]|uniref:prephenate dehydrogenase n=1 Tax=Aquisalinus flavus TaxID=1526572 RepID=A0A8J2Y801_9PROT|nr:prephenate/arogenate dehydrogenase family protein [Aquisalinus flavus]MBD0426127.1 prephenate/arogenate dehydrogenase family protein [Aquisalinus flavus]UNE48288.1 prephenate/arogenate dehydrogenase family protein [Aquisalinus flavus]GGD10419.1 cyclohexadienyl dehydrogenase [Aquisalinus flavus]